MRVTLELPDRVWGALATLADEKHVDINTVISTALRDIVSPKTEAEWRARARRAHVLRLVREGHPDAVVAERTGELRQYVAGVRRKAGLPANQFRGKPADSNGRKTA